MIYFSAHWCPPCRAFTPQLASKYKDVAAERNVEIVFVSSDKSQAEFDSYYGEMPWLALAYPNRAKKEELAKKFGVRGIPMLVVLNGKTGEVITTEGRASVNTYLGDGTKRETCSLM